MSGPFEPKGRRDAWFRVLALFGIVILLLVFSLQLLGGGGSLAYPTLIAGVAVAVLFNLWMLIRARTTQITWMPGGESAVLRSALEYLGIAPGLWVNAWKAIAGVAIALALVVLVIG